MSLSIVVGQIPPDDSLRLRGGQFIVANGFQEVDDDIESGSPENLFMIKVILAYQAGEFSVLEIRGLLRISVPDDIPSEIGLVEKRPQRNFDDLLNLMVSAEPPGMLHETDQRENRFPEKDQVIGGQGA